MVKKYKNNYKLYIKESDDGMICVKYKGSKYLLKELKDYALSLGDSVKDYTSKGYLIICTDDVHIYYLNKVAKQLGLPNGVKTDVSCNESVYTDAGFKNRADYLQSLADDFGVDINTVKDIAYILGPDEDFDGLVTQIEDIADDLEETEDFDPIQHYLDNYRYVVCSTDNTYENFDFIFPYDTYEFAGKELARDLIEYDTETCIFDTRNKTKTDYSPNKLDTSKLDEGGHGWVEDKADYINPEKVGNDVAIENIRAILDMCEVKTEKY